MKITKTEFTKLLNKIVSSLTTHFKDPKVITYNFYDNTSGVGVKMVRQGKKMTIEDLALIVHDLTLEVRAGFAKQEAFNRKVDERLEKIEQDIIVIKKDIQDIKSCPTIARELKLIKQ